MAPEQVSWGNAMLSDVARTCDANNSQCKCDIPAHNYAFSFAPNAEWPNYYATSQQIHSYMHDVAKKYDCNKYIKYKHSINGATWNESKGKWDIQVQDGDNKAIHEEADVFVNAGGVLK